MSPNTEIVAAVSAPVGALLGALGKGWLDRKKRSQEETKIDAEAAQIIVDAAAALVVPLRSQVVSLGERVEVLERENASTKSTLHQAIAYIKDLLAWVDSHLPDKTPPRPPKGLGI